MNHDSVNSINDTVESRQIAEEARVTYYDLMDRDDWPHLMQHVQLEGVANLNRPNYMRIPQNVVRIDDLRYESTKDGDTKRSFNPVMFLHPSEFIDFTMTRLSNESNIITVVNTNSIPMFIQNNKAPEYWTTFDDEYVVFDSYDKEVDTTMHSMRSLVLAKVIPVWQSSDSFVPDMPDQMFSVFLAEVTAASFTYWKQGASPKDEQRAARGISRLRFEARKVDEHNEKARYGRKRTGFAGTSRSGDSGSVFFANQ
jgi:hypothetical protein